MNKLLVVCPTRGRVKRCEEMLCSASSTSTNADFVFYFDDDDPRGREYRYLFTSFQEPRVRSVMGPRKTTTELFNDAFRSFPDYEYYCLTNDDFFFHTPGWDNALCCPGKVCYGNDLLGGATLPTCPVICGSIVRSTGFLQLPGLRYMYGDQVWKEIGLKLGILKYFKDVIIEHRHWINKKGEIDAVYKETNSEETYRHDYEVFTKWQKEGLGSDIQKIKTMFDLRV